VNGLYHPDKRLFASVVAALLLAVFLAVDHYTRVPGGLNFLAPTRAALWLSVGLGASLGLVGLLWERHMLRHRRAFLLEFYRAPLLERAKWKYQRGNLIYTGWLLLLLWALIAWCVYAKVFLLPGAFAVVAVQFAGNRRLAGDFYAALQRMRERPELDPDLEALIRARLRPGELVRSWAQRRPGEITVDLVEKDVQQTCDRARTLQFRRRGVRWASAGGEGAADGEAE
jgi:hypothetical protein